MSDGNNDSELDLNKRLALEIRTQIEGSSEAVRKERLDTLYKKWVIKKPNQETTIFTVIEQALKNYGLTVSNLRVGNFERSRKLVIFEVTYLHLFFMQGKLSVENSESGSEDEGDDKDNVENNELTDIKMKFNKIFSALIDAENAIRSSLFLQTSMSEEEFKVDEGDVSLFRFTPIDYSQNTPYQNLLLYLLEQLMRKGYRRYNSECYKPIFNEKGYDTHAWARAMSLKEFIHEVTRKEINFNMWKNLTSSKDNVRSSVTYLSEYIGGEFEDLQRDRHVFSFKNGIYIIKKFKEYTNQLETGPVQGSWVDEWIPYEGENAKTLGSSIVACKYYDEIFDDCTNLAEEYGWFSIILEKCKYFKAIMDYQEWDEDVQKWLCILIGRNMYNLGELEEWQILAYLLGMAGSGKSTILTKIVKRIYETCDVGILSNNMERKFGLSALSEKFMFIGPEIKGNLSMEQSEFQSVISGEDVQIAEKHKIAKSVVWSVPGMLAGNEVPQYTDNSGSISRRMMVFKFDKKVKKGDTRLGKKLEKEISYIIQAAAKGYLEAIEKYGGSDIWDIVPQYFKKTKDDMEENTNALMHFLKSDRVKLGKDYYIRHKSFISAFNDHCREHNLGVQKWHSDYYLGPFSNVDVSIRKKCRRRYPNVPGARSYHGLWVFGVDLVSELDNAGDEEFQDPEEEEGY